jgi:L-lactate permease
MGSWEETHVPTVEAGWDALLPSFIVATRPIVGRPRRGSPPAWQALPGRTHRWPDHPHWGLAVSHRSCFRQRRCGSYFALWPVMRIVFNALLLYHVAVRSGRFDQFRDWVLNHLPNDRRVVLVVIGFCFGALLEGIAGFGTPVAITSSLLILVGYPPPGLHTDLQHRAGCLRCAGSTDHGDPAGGTGHWHRRLSGPFVGQGQPSQDDASQISQQLKQLGFEVITELNMTKELLLTALDRFANQHQRHGTPVMRSSFELVLRKLSQQQTTEVNCLPTRKATHCGETKRPSDIRCCRVENIQHGKSPFLLFQVPCVNCT